MASQAETVEVAVIGGGVAGLTAAALAARAGVSVRLFEQAPAVGGGARLAGGGPWPVGERTAAPPVLTGAGPNGSTRGLLKRAGALDHLELVPQDPLYAAVFPNHRYLAPADPERFRQELSILWPSQAPQIQSTLALLDQVGELYGKQDGPLAAGTPLARWHDESLAAFLGSVVKDPELRGAFTALWLYSGLPPQRLSAVHYAWLWREWHTGGTTLVRGGGAGLAAALRKSAEVAGAEIETGMGVRRILRKGGRVTGVETADGRTFNTQAVISTASPHDTFEDLLASEGQTAAGYPALRSFATSTSALQVDLKLKQPITAPAPVTLVHTTYDASEAFFDLQQDEPEFASLAILVHGEPDSPTTSNRITLYAIYPYARYDHWKVSWSDRKSDAYRSNAEYQQIRETLAEWMVDRADDLFPDLADMIQEQRVTTPLTVERETFSAAGAAYGWALLPDQSGVNRPGAKTSFTGLYMAGQWAAPGGGIQGSLISAERAIRAAGGG